MMDDYDATILVDSRRAENRRERFISIEPEINKLDDETEEVVSAHSMTPFRRSANGRLSRWTIAEGVSGRMRARCSESEDGRMGLSEKIQTAIEPAVNMIEKLIANLRGGMPASAFASENNQNQIVQGNEHRIGGNYG